MALQAVFTGRKALWGELFTRHMGVLVVPPCKEGIAISNFRSENAKEVL